MGNGSASRGYTSTNSAIHGDLNNARGKCKSTVKFHTAEDFLSDRAAIPSPTVLRARTHRMRIAHARRMGSLFATFLMLQEVAHESNSSGAIGSLLWIGIIAVVMICLIVLGFFGLRSRNDTKT